MYPQVLLKNRKPDRIATIGEYRDSGGYLALENSLGSNSPSADDIRKTLLEAELLGRGGAAFPMGKKMSTVPDDAPFPRYLLCNADEMEPGTFKDRVLIHADPHQLIEGIVLAARAIRAEIAVIFVRREYENAARILEREIETARDAGFVGKDLLGSGFDCEVTVHRSAGRYICGEGTALINALQGRRANPKRPPPYSTEKGLWGFPTEVQNVETLCCVPHVVRNGAGWFRSLSLTENTPGTKVFSVSGRVKKPGCYELPMGVKLSAVIEEHAGGMIEGSTFKTCMPGGASTQFMPESMYHVSLDYRALAAEGYRLGTGAIMVFDHKTCLLRAAANLMRFFARESCGWCTPCREGLPYILELLDLIESGEGKSEYVEMIRQMCSHMKHAYCAFALGAAAPVQSLLEYFEDEVSAHLEKKGCPFKDVQFR
ncbi:MAG: NADH-quinone oxidoreductase subunit F [Desulfobacterales bacterium]